MKIVINKCWGGFGLSPLAVKELAKLNGRKCYFFIPRREESYYTYERISLAEATRTSEMWMAHDVPDCSAFEKAGAFSNTLQNQHYLTSRPDDRSDPKLIQVVEKLGCKRASGQMAELEIVEIPDGVEYEIDDYDGRESVHEKHRSWG